VRRTLSRQSIAYVEDMVLELRHLRYFLAVAEEGHITRAAEKLGIQQPPLSQQIRALERELQVQLFRRLPRGVELTSAGAALLVEARSILKHIEHAGASARRAARGETGRIAVGFTTSAPFHPFVPRVIRSFNEAFPSVSMALEENGSIELLSSLRAHQLDAAFVRTPIADQDDIDSLILFEERMVIAFPKGHPLIGPPRQTLSLKKLAAETFIGYRRPSGPGLYDAVIAACHSCGFSPRMGQDAPRMSSTLNLVAAGIGISIVPQSLQRMNLHGIVYRDLRDTQLVAPLYLATSRSSKSAVLRQFILLTKRMLKEVNSKRQ
jgi:DNA-binding transcriptional LysR family regulator